MIKMSGDISIITANKGGAATCGLPYKTKGVNPDAIPYIAPSQQHHSLVHE
jgi:hypothetical protein